MNIRTFFAVAVFYLFSVVAQAADNLAVQTALCKAEVWAEFGPTTAQKAEMEKAFWGYTVYRENRERGRKLAPAEIRARIAYVQENYPAVASDGKSFMDCAVQEVPVTELKGGSLQNGSNAPSSVFFTIEEADDGKSATIKFGVE